MSSFFNGVMVYFMEQSKKQLIRELFLKKCRRWDSNPQGVNHMNLNHARLPIPPLRQEKVFNFQCCILSTWRKYSPELIPSQKTIFNRFFRQSATSTGKIHLIINKMFSFQLFDILKKFFRD